MTAIITIDGPCAAGKTSTAKAVARELALLYIDTGAFYRTVALETLARGWDSDALVADHVHELDITSRFENGQQVMYCNGRHVREADLRTPQISDLSSRVSTIPAVREHLLQIERKTARGMHCIMEGRDAGSHVLPNAGLKIYLTANRVTRGERRLNQIRTDVSESTSETLAHVIGDLALRDHRDSNRADAPLVVPKKAVVMDNTYLTLDETVAAICAIIRTRFPDCHFYKLPKRGA